MGIFPKLHILGLPRGTPTVWLPPNSAEGTSLGGRLGRTGYTPGLAQPTTRHCGNFPWKQRPGWALPRRVWLSSRSHPQGCPLSLPAPFSPSPSLALAAEASPDHHPAPAQRPCSVPLLSALSLLQPAPRPHPGRPCSHSDPCSCGLRPELASAVGSHQDTEEPVPA